MNHSQHRGAATLEALLTITVFIIVWAGVGYVGKLFNAKIAAQASARSCAWRIAVAACEDIPPDCAQSKLSETEATDKTRSLQKTSSEASAGKEEGSALQERIDNEVEGLLMKRITTSAEVELTQPPLLGGESVQMMGSYSLPCNTKPQSLGDIVKDMKDSVLGKIL